MSDEKTGAVESGLSAAKEFVAAKVEPKAATKPKRARKPRVAKPKVEKAPEVEAVVEPKAPGFIDHGDVHLHIDEFGNLLRIVDAKTGEDVSERPRDIGHLVG